MSNFTKSVIYSTAVLAIGLVGIMAISGQRDDQGAIAGLEPAAGESSIGVDLSKGLSEGGEQADASASEESAVPAPGSMAAELEAVEEEVIKKNPDSEIDMGTESSAPESTAPAAGEDSATATEGDASAAPVEGIEGGIEVEPSAEE